MNCPKCGAPIAPGAAFCANCGATVSAPAPAPAPQPAAQPIPQQNAYNAYPQTPPAAPSYQQPGAQIPPEYKPLSPWAYFGYGLLLGIPVIGFILAIVFSIDSSNINRRNFVRTYWIGFVIAIIVGIIAAVLAAVFGVSLANEVSNFSYY